MKNKRETWIDAERHLPAELRDFHDQKDLFKTIHDNLGASADDMIKDITWPQGQVYVIDVFLWFLAHHGYTLQRSRAKVQFLNLTQTLAAGRQRRADSFASLLGQAAQPEGPPEQ